MGRSVPGFSGGIAYVDCIRLFSCLVTDGCSVTTIHVLVEGDMVNCITGGVSKFICRIFGRITEQVSKDLVMLRMNEAVYRLGTGDEIWGVDESLWFVRSYIPVRSQLLHRQYGWV